MLKVILNPYLINIILMIIYGFIILENKKIKNPKKIFVILASVQWIILSGLRHISIGADTMGYKVNFLNIANTDWSLLLKDFVDIIFLGAEGKDPGYSLFVKITQLFTVNYQVYLIIIALIFFIPLGYFIYKHSKEPLISYLIFSTLFYSFFAITGHRQTISTALVVFIGYEFILKRRFLSFLILVTIAFTIHKSSLIFIPFYFLYNFKIKRFHLIVGLISFAVLMIFRAQYMIFLGDISGYEYSIYDGAGTFNFTLLFVSVYIVVILKLPIILANNKKSNHFINSLLIALLLLPLTWVNPSTMRSVQYFSIFLLLIIPGIVLSFNNTDRPIVYTVAVVTLLILFLMNLPEYYFYWQ